MKIDINKDFETAYQQSIWKGTGSETAAYGLLLFANGNRDYGCPLVFLKSSAPGRRVYWNFGGISDSGFRTV